MEVKINKEIRNYTETLSWMCVLGAAPCGAMGFIRYNGMTAEQFVWA